MKMTEALRYNEGKPKLSYFARSFRWMNAAVARVKEFGANKYDDENWRLGNKPDQEYLDSLFRHLDYFFAGEFYDQDSGCSHLAHAVWNLSALAELNHGDKPIVDTSLFNERMKYWSDKKAVKVIEQDKILKWKGPEIKSSEIDEEQIKKQKDRDELFKEMGIEFIMSPDAKKCESFQKILKEIYTREGI
jgi:hypothetical protein